MKVLQFTEFLTQRRWRSRKKNDVQSLDLCVESSMVSPVSTVLISQEKRTCV